MNKLFKLTTVILLVLLLCFAVGCRDKDYVTDYSNDMPTLPSKTEGTESGSTASGEEQQGEDNVMDVDDLLNPDKYNEEQSKNQSGSSSKTSTGSSSSTASSKPSSSNSSQSTSSSKPSSSQSTTSVENDMAAGAETDKVPYVEIPDKVAENIQTVGQAIELIEQAKAE